MRLVLVFSLLILIFCVGCLKTVPEPNDKNEESEDMPATNRSEPWIEPRFLPDGTPFLPENTESPNTETTGTFAQALGKYAAEVVPLPPLEDLTVQIDDYMTKMGESLESLVGNPRYATDSADIVRDANALALLVLAVGLAEADSKYKKPASQIIASAQNLAAAKTLEEGQKAYTALKASLTSTDGGKKLAWSDKVANLTPAMKALPNLSSAVKRATDTERKLNSNLDGRAPQIFGQIAAMAVITQGAIPNVAETTKPDAEEEWKKYCEEFRDAALNANAATRHYAKERAEGKEPDYTVFDVSFKAMTTSCDDCHSVFYPKAVGR